MWWFRQSAIGNFVTHVIRVALLYTHNAPTSFVLRQSRNSDWQRRRCLPPAAPRSSRQPAPATGWRRAAASERRSHSSESAGLTPSPLLRRLTRSTNIKFYNTWSNFTKIIRSINNKCDCVEQKTSKIVGKRSIVDYSVLKPHSVRTILE